MAYGLKYYQSIKTLDGDGQNIYIYIYKKDYSGDQTQLTLEFNGVTIEMEDTDYFEPLTSTSAEIKIVNDFDDFFTLDELFSVNDFENYVKIYDSNRTYFEGFIPCDVVEQQFIKYGTITLNATTNINRLDEFYPTMFYPKGPYTLISIIKHCLSFTGLSLPIYVNCSLYEYSDPLSDSTTFDETFVLSDLFLENDTEYQDCKTILESILRSFSCKLYYWDGHWYIERIKDLGYAPKTYIVYNTNGTTTTSVYGNTTIWIGNEDTKIRFIETSQYVSYVPGKKQVKLTLKETAKVNLVPYYFNDISIVPGSQPEVYYPVLGDWTIDSDTIAIPFTNKYTMDNGVELSDASSTDIPIHSIGAISTEAENRKSLAGLFTRIQFDMNELDSLGDGSDTTLTIQLTFKLTQEVLDRLATTPPSYNNKSYLQNMIDDPENTIFYIRVFIRNPVGYHFVKYEDEDSTDAYKLVTRTNIFYDGDDDLGNYDSCVLEQSITFDEFTDKGKYLTDIEMTVPFDDFRDSLVSNYFILGICEIGFSNPHLYYPDLYYSLCSIIIGDIIVTVNADEEDNVVTGDINDDFVDNLEEDIVLYDSKNNSILNGLYKTEELTSHTTLWEDATAATSLPLSKKIIEDAFQIYHVVRHEISSDCYYKFSLKPFTIIGESHYTNKFYLSGFHWIIDSGEWTDVILKEYVGDDDVT